MKIRFKNEFGMPMNLLAVDQITLHFAREDGGFLVKRDFTIEDAQKGVVSFELSGFEIQALKTGPEQDFFGKVVSGDEETTIRFAKGLCIIMKDQRKVIDEQVKASI